MTSDTIMLSDYRRSGVKTPGGIYFPTLYRVTACHRRIKEGRGAQPGDFGDFEPDPTSPVVFYALDEMLTHTYGNEQRAAITHLDPVLDRGWIFIRYWGTRNYASCYTHGLFDAGADRFSEGIWTYQTAEGTFTILHRPATPGCRDCMVVYFDMPVFDAVQEWVHIVMADGTMSDDTELLMPP